MTGCGKKTRSKIKQKAINIILSLDPERLAIVVRMLERHHGGMPMDEASRLCREEARAEGLLPDGAVYPLDDGRVV